MGEISYSAPAKVIITGEHSVVYGKLAIAAAVDLRCRARLKLSRANAKPGETTLMFTILSENAVSIPNEQILDLCRGPYSDMQSDFKPNEEQIASLRKLVNQFTNSKFFSLATQCFLHDILTFLASDAKLREEFMSMNWQITLESEVPLGAGLGSSAAVNTVMSACVLHALGSISPGAYGEEDLCPKDMEKVNTLAFAAEHIVHGKPSGIDTFASCYGKAIVFENLMFSSLTDIPLLDVLIVDTKQERNTKSLVEKVLALKQNECDRFEDLLSKMQSCAQSILKTVQMMTEGATVASLFGDFCALIFENHELLRQLGVSTEKLDEVVKIAKGHNCCAKLTGAGGGGCAIVFLNPNATNQSVTELLFSSFSSEGFAVLKVKLGCHGVRKV